MHLFVRVCCCWSLSIMYSTSRSQNLMPESVILIIYFILKTHHLLCKKQNMVLPSSLKSLTCIFTCACLLKSLHLTVVECKTVTSPTNGQVSHTTGTTYRQTATYSCDTGYNLVGDNNRTCQATGVWSGNTPICQSMSLLEPV